MKVVSNRDIGSLNIQIVILQKEALLMDLNQAFGQNRPPIVPLLDHMCKVLNKENSK